MFITGTLPCRDLVAAAPLPIFWKVVEAMDNSDRAALLAFAWGRRRMPLSNAGVQLKLDLLSGRGDEALPEAHTCFFSIDLPEYSSEETLRTKLLYAIHNCTAIDNDFHVRDGAPPAARLAPSPPLGE